MVVVVSPQEQRSLDQERKRWREAIDGYWNAKREPTQAKVDKHLLRERRLGRVSTEFNWQEVLKLYGHKCGLCRVSIHDEMLTVDHIIPLSRGGGNYQWNIRPLCEYCNSSKGSSLDAECWVGRQEGQVGW